MPAWLYAILRLGRQLWWSAALYSLLGVTAALLAVMLDQYVPASFPLQLGSEAVDDILSIIASSMLAVTTFSLATLVTAYTAVGSSINPRLAGLVVADRTVRSVLGTFIGAFIYAVVGIVALHTGFYGEQARVILFFITLGVLVLVIVAMLRWIGELSILGQSSSAIGRVAEAASRALKTAVVRYAWLQPSSDEPDWTCWVEADQIGFVQNIDLSAIERLAEDCGVTIHLMVLPGDFVRPGQALAGATGAEGKLGSRLRRAISIGHTRSFDQDPRYALTVMGEIAGRALSPAINDPGTARAVLAAGVISLDEWTRCELTLDDAPACRVHLRALGAQELLAPLFGPILRFGQDHPELTADRRTLARALQASPDRRPPPPPPLSSDSSTARRFLCGQGRSLGLHGDGHLGAGRLAQTFRRRAAARRTP